MRGKRIQEAKAGNCVFDVNGFVSRYRLRNSAAQQSRAWQVADRMCCACGGPTSLQYLHYQWMLYSGKTIARYDCRDCSNGWVDKPCAVAAKRVHLWCSKARLFTCACMCLCAEVFVCFEVCGPKMVLVHLNFGIFVVIEQQAQDRQPYWWKTDCLHWKRLELVFFWLLVVKACQGFGQLLAVSWS